MLEVGQKLWWVPYRRGESCEVTVTKVGKKWAYLDNRHRIELTTLVADPGNFSSAGRCHVDKDAYLVEQVRCCLWRELQLQLSHKSSPPNNVTTADITAAAALLTIKIGTEK